jgi:hypothetical protein
VVIRLLVTRSAEAVPFDTPMRVPALRDFRLRHAVDLLPRFPLMLE